ncbi:MAG: hypothetical protein JXB49_04635 [Bacteroidales bacterium]|nr:hypothetical protein [Bacteroidales bacterium]
MNLYKIGVAVFLLSTSIQSRLMSYTFEGTVSKSEIKYCDNGINVTEDYQDISVGKSVTYSMLVDLESDGYFIDETGNIHISYDDTPSSDNYYGDFFYNEFNGDYLLPDLTQIDDVTQSHRGCDLYNFNNTNYTMLYAGQYYHYLIISSAGIVLQNAGINQRFQGVEYSKYKTCCSDEDEYTLAVTTTLFITNISDPFASVPEPSGNFLFSAGFISLVLLYRKQKMKNPRVFAL